MTDGRDTTIRLRGGIDVWALSLNSKKKKLSDHSFNLPDRSQLRIVRVGIFRRVPISNVEYKFEYLRT